MSIIGLDDFKLHLNIYDSSDDFLIDGKLEAAQAYVESILGFTFAVEYPDPAEPPADLKEAVRQMAAHLYENREATAVGISVAEMPLSLHDILANHRRYSFGA